MSNDAQAADALPAGLSHPLRLADLPQRKATRFDLVPDAAQCKALADQLGLSDLRKLRFAGSLSPRAGRDWHLDATLGASVVQPCGITLEPVKTRIEDPVQRHYSADAHDHAPGGEAATGAEMEMPEDDTVEPLPDRIDLAAVMVEALILAIPAFPRAPDAELGAVLAGPEGTDPLDDAALKPFAGLAGLRDSLANKD